MKEGYQLNVKYDKQLHANFNAEVEKALQIGDENALFKLIRDKLISEKQCQKIAAWYVDRIQFDPYAFIESAIDKNSVNHINALLNSYEKDFTDDLRKKQDKLKLQNESLAIECAIVEKQIEWINQNKTYKEIQENVKATNEKIINEAVESFFTFYDELDRNEFYIEGQHYNLTDPAEKNEAKDQLRNYFIKTTNKYRLKISSNRREKFAERWKDFLNTMLVDLKEEFDSHAEELKNINMRVCDYDNMYRCDYEARVELVQHSILGHSIKIEDYVNHEDILVWIAEAIVHRMELFNAKSHDRSGKTFIQRAIEKSSAAVSLRLFDFLTTYGMHRRKWGESYPEHESPEMLDEAIQSELNKIPFAVLSDDDGNTLAQQIIMQCGYDEKARIVIYQLIGSNPDVLKSFNKDGLSVMDVVNPNGESLLTLTIKDLSRSLGGVVSKEMQRKKITTECFMKWIGKWAKSGANVLHADHQGLTGFDRLYALLPTAAGDSIRDVLQRRLVRELDGQTISTQRYGNNDRIQKMDWQPFPLLMLKHLVKHWKYLSESITNLTPENAKAFVPEQQEKQSSSSYFFGSSRSSSRDKRRSSGKEKVDDVDVSEQAMKTLRTQQAKIDLAIKYVVESHISGYDNGLSRDIKNLIEDFAIYQDENTKEFIKVLKKEITNYEGKFHSGENLQNDDMREFNFDQSEGSSRDEGVDISDSRSDDECISANQYRF